jgi:hypothetical protein
MQEPETQPSVQEDVPSSQAVPASLHVSTFVPSQRVLVGAQGASQRPAVQVVGQAVTRSQAVPSALQTSTSEPLQRVAPGLHAAAGTQMPPEQPFGQEVSVLG